MDLGAHGPQVLLVEDDGDGRRLYALWLTEARFTVKEARNGLQARNVRSRASRTLSSPISTFLESMGRAGCDVILEKPCSPDDPEAAIRTLINANGAPH